MDLKDVCLELCAGGILMKALELVKLPNYQSLDPWSSYTNVSRAKWLEGKRERSQHGSKNQHASTRTRVLRILCTGLTAI